ncbi:MAG: hypothetical protein COZ06_24985 [Armatimonadetes bacterium CG_4_10_14_3_um_filter_66_18]|nr:MAG: hypothetical protein AUJ96_07150 [Armatimonadetes bacterium CG2_30_66_41]PIU93875.1 MAG: hypothetical protein COS65_10420 [Armatimonadetes bacterium CG06_land_8_20_14_3_00_66_21]PIW13050.1 MAG: hypothetical protein COW34_11765 [Armatimonadetes bacterium CG17_big_fil_post_rev_8_21_14_2_50_66_6]PIX43151.1 MAG: hypothetical protein COZ57_19690 [Armatimonadetes bacterium CG_4_8_14_3_um_filter_66_20]PIY42596.1 MAG: hypothetical protein COZ06_24985 [Armatimonadetes bacterium CG_4_10_14_3_um_f
MALAVLAVVCVGGAGAVPLPQLGDEFWVQWRAFIGGDDVGVPSVWTGFSIQSYFGYPRLPLQTAERMADRLPRDWQVQLAAAEWMAMPPEAFEQKPDGSYSERPQVMPKAAAVKARYERALSLAPEDQVPLCRYLIWILRSLDVREEDPRSVAVGPVSGDPRAARWPGTLSDLERLVRRGAAVEPANAFCPFVLSLLRIGQGRNTDALAALERAASAREFNLHVKESTQAHTRLGRLSGLPQMEAQWAARTQSVNLGFKTYALCRSFARMACSLGDGARQAGDHQTAIRWYVGAFRLATLLGETGWEEYEVLVGLACGAIVSARFPLTPEETARFQELRRGNQASARRASRYRREAMVAKLTRYLTDHGAAEAGMFVRDELSRLAAALDSFREYVRQPGYQAPMRNLAVARFAASVALAQFVLLAALGVVGARRRQATTAGQPSRWVCLTAWLVCVGGAPLAFVALVDRMSPQWWVVRIESTGSPYYRNLSPVVALGFVIGSVALYALVVFAAQHAQTVQAMPATKSRPVRGRPLLLGAALSGALWVAFLCHSTIHRAALADIIDRRTVEGSARSLWESVEKSVEAAAPGDASPDGARQTQQGRAPAS